MNSTNLVSTTNTGILSKPATMKMCYTRKLSPVHLAIADLCEFHDAKGHGMLLTRINVPFDFRGQGIGTSLLAEVVHQADVYKVDLFLAINPYGSMGYVELEAWYNRYGFKKLDDIHCRRHL